MAAHEHTTPLPTCILFRFDPIPNIHGLVCIFLGFSPVRLVFFLRWHHDSLASQFIGMSVLRISTFSFYPHSHRSGCGFCRTCVEFCFFNLQWGSLGFIGTKLSWHLSHLDGLRSITEIDRLYASNELYGNVSCCSTFELRRPLTSCLVRSVNRQGN